MKKERVAICIPSGDTWKALTAFHLMSLGAYSAPHVTMLPINVRGQDTAEARNQMTAAALDAEAEWLLWVDADMVFPPNGLLRLLAHDLDIVGADYRRRSPPYPRLGKPLHPDQPSNLVEFSFLGLGFMLIRAKVLRAMHRPWWLRMWLLEHATADNPSGFSTEDGYFCGHARSLGYQVWCDMELSREVGHIAEAPISWNLAGSEPIEGVSCLKSSA